MRDFTRWIFWAAVLLGAMFPPASTAPAACGETPAGTLWCRRPACAKHAGKTPAPRAGETPAPQDPKRPRLDFDALLFVKRYTYQSSHIYTEFVDGIKRYGGNLCVLSPVAPDGKVTELVPQLAGGVFGRFDLSCDARRIVFAWKKDAGTPFHIYEVDVDGRRLRQLTHDAYDDMDPCFLPGGKIAMVSTRVRRTVSCFDTPVAVLHVMDADGAHIRCLSPNTLNEFTPSVMNDGRILYTRWEYVDKGNGQVQSLWCVHPDGTQASHVYKNNVSVPGALIDALAIPGSHRFIATGSPHSPASVGPVVLVDTQITQLGRAAMTNLTPDVPYVGQGGVRGQGFYGQKGYFKQPYPLSEDTYLVAYNPGGNWAEPAGYGLYLLDRSRAAKGDSPIFAGQRCPPPAGAEMPAKIGTVPRRELIYRDAKISCFQPVPLRPRPMPPVLAAVVDAAAAAARPATGTLVLADVYQGLTGIARGRAKYLRVMEEVPKPWGASERCAASEDRLGLQNPVVAYRGPFVCKRMHGVVKLAADGSARFTVPAGRDLYFQVLDENFMELQRMRTFVNLMPGEIRGCIGCHESRTRVPSPAGVMALREPVQSLAPQPGDVAPRAIHYPLDVQPALDKHCVRCHSGPAPKGKLDLSDRPTQFFSKSYENLIDKRLVDNIDVDPRDNRIPAEPPLSVGSHRSRLVRTIRAGHREGNLSPAERAEAQLSPAEFIKLVTWIDADAGYYGSYEGKRNIKWQGRKDFRTPPTPADNDPDAQPASRP